MPRPPLEIGRLRAHKARLPEPALLSQSVDFNQTCYFHGNLYECYATEILIIKCRLNYGPEILYDSRASKKCTICWGYLGIECKIPSFEKNLICI
jgi:hypothetical protein